MVNMSSRYSIFVKLGSNKDLSKLELSVLLDKLGLDDIAFTEWMDYVFLKLNRNVFSKFFKLLENTGSLVKAGYLNLEANIEKDEEWKLKCKNHLTKNIDKHSSEKTKQLKISLDVQAKNLELRNNIVNYMRKTITKYTDDQEIQSRILGIKKSYSQLTPYQYYKENLHKRGFEITSFVVKSKVIFGVSNWVTNPLLDIKQDEGRQTRIFTHGTSIKLARTLVFLSEVTDEGIVLDPFCGTGTILIEALKQKLQTIGVDKDPKCYRATKDNLNSFSLRFPAKVKMKDKWSVYSQDSRYLSKILGDTKIDSIVTEPFLGPFLKDLPSKEVAKSTMISLEKLYIKVLKEGTKFLKESGKVIFIIPVYRYPDNVDYLPNIEKIANQCSLHVYDSSKFFHVSLPVQIGRKHNIINRYLVVFEKQSS
jgi:tRNA G10  N-methylase Trm11